MTSSSGCRRAETAEAEIPVAVVGGGVVGVAVARALAQGGVAALVLEAEDELARAASGTNFRHAPHGLRFGAWRAGDVLMRRSATARCLPRRRRRAGPALRRDPLPAQSARVSAVAAVAATARANGVEATLRDDGALELPGEG